MRAHLAAEAPGNEVRSHTGEQCRAVKQSGHSATLQRYHSVERDTILAGAGDVTPGLWQGSEEGSRAPPLIRHRQ